MNHSWVISTNHWADAVMPAVLRASWQGGLFIAVVWVICKVFRSLPAAGRNWLWWIASVQMLVRLVSIATLPLPLLPAPQEVNANGNAAQIDLSAPTREYGDSQVSRHFETTVIRPPAPAPQKAPAIPPSPAALMMGIWLVGVGLSIAFSLKRLTATRRMLSHAEPITDGPILEIVQEFCTDSGLKQPRLLESNLALCPLLAGWLHPAIVVPLEIVESLDESQLRMALAHEFAHLRRHDLWLGIVPALTQCLFFFHPLAWLATHEGAATRESACDSDALRISGATPAAFARLLLNTAQSRSSMAVLGTAFGYRLIHRRISMLKTLTASNTRRYRGASTIVLALAALCALPWSVTAQSGTHAIPTTKAKKTSKSHKASAKKHFVTNSVGKKSSKVVASNSATREVPTLPAGAVATSRPVGVGMQAPAALAGSGVGTYPPARAGQGRIGIGGTAPAGGIIATGVGTFGRSASAAPQGVGVGNRSGFGIGGGFSSASSQAPATGGFGRGGGFGGATAASPAQAMAAGVGTATTPAKAASGGSFGGGIPVGNTAPVPVEGFVSPAFGAGGGSLIQRRDSSHPSKCEVTNDGDNVELDRAELHTALVEIFKAKHCNFVIKSDVEPDIVTASLHGMSIEGILRTILGSAHQHLTFRRDEDGIYTVLPVQK